MIAVGKVLRRGRSSGTYLAGGAAMEAPLKRCFSQSYCSKLCRTECYYPDFYFHDLLEEMFRG